jgi:hypothetical protein
VPAHPPEAVHEVAFVEVQVSVVVPPEVTEGGLAERVTVAAGATVIATDTVALVPPAPVQLSE